MNVVLQILYNYPRIFTTVFDAKYRFQNRIHLNVGNRVVESDITVHTERRLSTSHTRSAGKNLSPIFVSKTLLPNHLASQGIILPRPRSSHL